MIDNSEIQEGAGGWKVPNCADSHGLKEEMVDRSVTFRKFTSAFEVFLDGNESINISNLSSRHGFAIADVTLIDGPFDVKVILKEKQLVRQIADSKEHNHRLSDFSEGVHE